MTVTDIAPYLGEKQSFNPNEHIMKLKSKEGAKDYLPVQWRLVWFREQCPQGTIDTEEIVVDLDRECEAEVYVWNQDTKRSEKVVKRAPGYARYRAIVTDGKGGRATGTKTERGVNFPDFVEKAETGAIGRALAALGYGTQFAPELDEHERIVDAPTNPEKSTRPYNERRPFVEADKPKDQALHDLAKPGSYEQHHGEAEHSKIAASMTDQQEASIRKLCEHLGKPMPEFVEASTYAQAKALIEQLSKEYREQHEANGHQEPERGAQDISPAIQRMIDIAKHRAEKLGVSWETVKKEARVNFPDTKLVAASFVHINGWLTQQEKASAGAGK